MNETYFRTEHITNSHFTRTNILINAGQIGRKDGQTVESYTEGYFLIEKPKTSISLG